MSFQYNSEDLDMKQTEIQHNHDHKKVLTKRRLTMVLFITFSFMIIEAVVGYTINSLALVADAGHMANDVLSILLALVAISISQLKKSSHFTFGFNRVEVFSGLINGFSLLGIALYIILEAVNRFNSSSNLKINGFLLLSTAFVGLIVNIIGMTILKESSEDNINVEGAYHHIIADLLGSVAAIFAGVIIIIWGVYWIDLVVSVVISVLILRSGLSITLKAVKILLEATPHGLNIDKLLEELSTLSGVVDIHDLHVWTITSGQNMITGHVTIMKDADIDQLLNQIKQTVLENYQVHHPTFQLEFTSCENELDCFPTTNKEVTIPNIKN